MVSKKMPMRRSKRTQKRSFKGAGQGSIIPRAVRARNNPQIEDIVRTVSLNLNPTNLTGPTIYFKQDFLLNNVPNYTELTNLYEFYRIKAIKVQYFSFGGAGSYTGGGALFGVSDADGFLFTAVTTGNTALVAPTSLSDITEWQSFKNHGHYMKDQGQWQRTFAPVPYAGDKNNSNIYDQSNRWISTTDAGATPHAGIIGCVSLPVVPATVLAINCIATYYMEFKRAK